MNEDILKVYQPKQGSLGRLFSDIDQVKLFPPPHPEQVAEFRNLANNLIRMHSGESGLVVVFSSASRGEGTSSVSYHVARTLHSLMDRKIAWVDGNFLSPQSGLRDETYNFRNILDDPTLLETYPVAESLTLVPNGTGNIKPTDLLQSRNFDYVLQCFSEEFYMTIIDAPPFLESVDVAHLAAKAHGLIVVVESRGLKHEVIRHGLDNLADHGVRILGAVLNKRVYDIPRTIYRRL